MVSKAGFDDVGMTRGISPEELGESSPQLMGQERRQKDGCVFLQNWTSKRKLQWVFFFFKYAGLTAIGRQKLQPLLGLLC